MPIKAPTQTNPAKGTQFRWVYIILPAVLLVVAIVLAALFYSRLPGQLAYHFSAGAPDRWVSRAAFIYWTVVPQAVFALLSFAIVRTILLVVSRWAFESPVLEKLLLVMGNLLALPQLIVLFTMLDVFLYNSYQVKLISVWVFALAVLALGAIILGILLVRAGRQARRLYDRKQE